MTKIRPVFSFAIIAMLALAGCRTAVPIESVNKASYGSAIYAQSQALTLEDYEKAIVRAGTRRGWVMQPVSAGHLEATNNVRNKHTVVIEILFDTETFSINHKRSRNMDWNPSTGVIHPNYNIWVGLLETDIKAEIQRMRAS